MPYTFQSVKSMEILTDSSKLYNFIEDFSDYGNQFSLICGKIKALFGQPIYETKNLENLFSYCILATSEEAEEVYLDIYCAGSGLAVGGISASCSVRYCSSCARALGSSSTSAIFIGSAPLCMILSPSYSVPGEKTRKMICPAQS